MPSVLLVDDDAALLDVLALAFEDAGYDVLRAGDGRAALEVIRGHRPDVVLSDVNMPHIDGFALCRRLREKGDAVPLVLLTSRDSEIDEALGLEIGADDYVTKPFSTRVLLARVAALLRREELRAGGVSTAAVLRRGELELDAERLACTFHGTPVPLTVTEFRLLESLAHRPGVVFSRDKLLALARDDDSVVVERIVDTYVNRLRRKLEAIDPSFDAIETVIGAGYRWRTP
ncbi:MAG TPA: response regulator transcription factor [Polyangiaceae bacterium]|jgi:DNA-binding response OmpR family regulator